MKEWLTIRHAAGAVLLALFFYITGRGLVVGEGFDAMTTNLWTGIKAFACLIASACCFSSALSELLARPFHGMVDAIYFGRDDREPPPVNLRLAQAYRSERRYEEAIAECERQLDFHPKSPELWAEMIQSARASGDWELTEELRQRAARKLNKRDQLLLQ